MVWSLRLICYFSNVLFWNSMKGSLDSVISIPLVSDSILWTYSILCFGFIEKKVEQKYKPKYKDLGLSDEVYYYRVRKERVIFTAWIFCGVNFVLGTLASLVVYGAFSSLAVLGLVGLVGASLFTMFGCVCLVARGVESGERSPFQMLFGFGFLIPPAVYLVIMVYYAFLL